jgi:hypothetical protein
MEHRPLQPEWICAGDGKRWPCMTAQTILLAHQPDRETLARHLLHLAAEAAEDLNIGPARLYRRFVGWALPDEAACRLCGRGGHDVLPGVPPRLLPCAAGTTVDAVGTTRRRDTSATSARRA